MNNEFNTTNKAEEFSEQDFSDSFDVQGNQFIAIWGGGEKWW